MTWSLLLNCLCFFKLQQSLSDVVVLQRWVCCVTTSPSERRRRVSWTGRWRSCLQPFPPRWPPTPSWSRRSTLRPPSRAASYTVIHWYALFVCVKRPFFFFRLQESWKDIQQARERGNEWATLELFNAETNQPTNKQNNKKQTSFLTLLLQIGVSSGSFRITSVRVKLISGSKWGAARSAGDTHPVPERRDPAAPGSVQAAQHGPRDEWGELTHLDLLYRQCLNEVISSCCPCMDPVQPLVQGSVETHLKAGWWHNGVFMTLEHDVIVTYVLLPFVTFISTNALWMQQQTVHLWLFADFLKINLILNLDGSEGTI